MKILKSILKTVIVLILCLLAFNKTYSQAKTPNMSGFIQPYKVVLTMNNGITFRAHKAIVGQNHTTLIIKCYESKDGVVRNYEKEIKISNLDIFSIEEIDVKRL